MYTKPLNVLRMLPPPSWAVERLCMEEIALHQYPKKNIFNVFTDSCICRLYLLIHPPKRQMILPKIFKEPRLETRHNWQNKPSSNLKILASLSIAWLLAFQGAPFHRHNWFARNHTKCACTKANRRHPSSTWMLLYGFSRNVLLQSFCMNPCASGFVVGFWPPRNALSRWYSYRIAAVSTGVHLIQ